MKIGWLARWKNRYAVYRYIGIGYMYTISLFWWYVRRTNDDLWRHGKYAFTVRNSWSAVTSLRLRIVPKLANHAAACLFPVYKAIFPEYKAVFWGKFEKIIMFKPVPYVAGSIHQGDEMFRDISRGRQCSFMSFSVLLCAQPSLSNTTLALFYCRSVIERRR